METPFIHNPQRDAWKAIRGFLYQVELTVIRWLNLERDTVLYCECGEDIDLVRQVLETDPNSQERLLEQVKVRDRITLNSAEALTSLVRFHQAAVDNPNIQIQFRFATTATPGNEQGAKFPRGLTGIEAWNALQEEEFSEEEAQKCAEAIRALISRASCPKELQEGVFRQFKEYVASTDSKVFIDEFVKRFEWATGLPDPRKLRDEIQSTLLQQTRAHMPREAQSLAEVLTVYVLRLLTEKEEKRLTVEDLEHVLHEGSISEFDRRLLTRLIRFAEQAEVYFSHFLSQMEFVSQGVVALQNQFNQLFQHVSGGSGQLLSMQLPPPDEPPHLPPVFSRRTELVQAFLADLSKVTWLSIVGATGIGKTFIATLLAEERGQACTTWISLRGEQTPNESLRRLELHLLRIASFPDRPDLVSMYFSGVLPFSQLVKQTALRLEHETLLVLDELPDLLKVPELNEKLVQLAIAMKETGGKILTTSQRNLPSSVKRHFDVAFVERQTPPMAIEEVQEMVIAAGAPPSFLRSRFLNFLYGVTYGHPALVAAVILFLRGNTWSVSDSQLSQILTGDPTGEVRSETRRKVFRLLSNDQLRVLLYRLSLINSSFDTTLLKAVAAVPPPIADSTDLLLELTGPWIHQIKENQFEVSPLLNGTGTDTLDPEVQKSVHKVVGFHYLREKTLDPLQAVRLIFHFLSASEWPILVPVLLRLASQINEKAHAEAFDLLGSLFPSSWPDAMPLRTRIAFRMIQIRILDLLNEDSQQFNEELGVLIQNVNAETRVAAFTALLLTGPLNPAANSLIAARKALQACRLYPSLPEQIRHTSLEKSLAALVWASLTKVKTRSDLRAILSVLRDMTASERRASFAQDAFREAAETFIAKC